MATEQETPEDKLTAAPTETNDPPAVTAGESQTPAEATDRPSPGQDHPIDEYERLQDFGAALDKWESGLKTLKEGDVVRGTVLKVLDKEVIVDIGYKSEGVIDVEEFRAGDGSLKVGTGDKVDVLLEKTEDSEGYVVLSKEKAERLKVWDAVERAYETGEPVVGRFVDRIKGGLKVDIGLPAFLPGSLVDIRPVRNLETLIGQEFQAKVIKVNKRRGNIVLSRKAVLEEENAEKKKTTLSELEDGKILRGVVKNLTEYGAFIDLGGLDGLLHITDMSWGRINHPSEKFQIGDEVDVVVLKFDRERERVSLGFKQLQDDPWDAVPSKYPAGLRIRGKVVSLTDYGAFVEVEEGVEGLIHVSEMSWTKRVKHPSKILSAGDWVECVVLDMDREGRRLSLGLKQTEPNPWDLINTKYRVGDKITGSVRNITDFGAFIEVEEGIDGLVHISDLSWTRRIKHPSEVLKKSDEVEATILKIDSENQRLSLGIKQLQPNVLEDFFQSHKVSEVLPGKIVRLTEFGAFVKLFEDVEGLVHVSEMAKDRIEKPEDAFAVDQEVRVKIIKMDPVEKKIGLSIKAALDDVDSVAVQSYAESQADDGTATLGDLMSAAVLRQKGAGQAPEAQQVETADSEAGEVVVPDLTAPEQDSEGRDAQAEAVPSKKPKRKTTKKKATTKKATTKKAAAKKTAKKKTAKKTATARKKTAKKKKKAET